MKTKARLRLTRGHVINAQGLELLRLALWSDDRTKELEHVTTVSGQSYAQEFRLGKDSLPGSMEPIPEGYYKTGPRPIWAGADGDFETWHSTALGPVVIDIWNAPGNRTRRSELRIHQDQNQERYPGTAGCIGVQGVKGDADFTRLKQILKWFADYEIEDLEVDYGLGSIKALPGR